nr:ATP-binding protein [Rickettsia endosymbiont of Ceutorhynchus assimilis]
MMAQAKPKQPEKGSETFDDIILEEGVEKVLKQISNDIKDMAIDPAPGYIFYGPPGNGKTFAARIIANESGVSFFNYSVSDIISNVPSMTAVNLRKIFEDARKHSPCIVFIDEIDGLLTSKGIFGALTGRSAEEAELLYQMDGFNSNKRVIVIGATNNPGVFKGALSRPGRFSEKIRFSPPETPQLQKKILESHMKKEDLSFEGVDVDKILGKTQGFSGAGLKDLVRAAHAGSIRRGSGKSITTADFITRIAEIKSNDDGFNKECDPLLSDPMSQFTGIFSQFSKVAESGGKVI